MKKKKKLSDVKTYREFLSYLRDNKPIEDGNAIGLEVLAGAENSHKYFLLKKEFQKIFAENSPEHLFDLLIEHLLMASIILPELNRKLFVIPKGSEYKVYPEILYSFIALMSSLINSAASNDKLARTCYCIARNTTHYLMNYAYKKPSAEFIAAMHKEMNIPFIISAWDTDKEIGTKFKENSKRFGLAEYFKIMSKPRISSVPTRVILEIYRNILCVYGSEVSRAFWVMEKCPEDDRAKYMLPPLDSKAFDMWWEATKPFCDKYFNALPKLMPEYYRNNLCDDRRDKTPVYIKRKLWFQACKQALKTIALAKNKQVSTDMIPGPNISPAANQVTGS